jgi:hypothetical protein
VQLARGVVVVAHARGAPPPQRAAPRQEASARGAASQRRAAAARHRVAAGCSRGALSHEVGRDVHLDQSFPAARPLCQRRLTLRYTRPLKSIRPQGVPERSALSEKPCKHGSFLWPMSGEGQIDEAGELQEEMG